MSLRRIKASAALRIVSASLPLFPLSSARRAALPSLVSAGVDVRTISVYPIHHDKVIVADRETVELGGFNYSHATARRNSENGLVNWRNATLAEVYLALFERNHRRRFLWLRSRSLRETVVRAVDGITRSEQLAREVAGGGHIHLDDEQQRRRTDRIRRPERTDLDQRRLVGPAHDRDMRLMIPLLQTKIALVHSGQVPALEHREHAPCRRAISL